MKKHNRDGKITFIELLLIVVIFVLGYFIVIAPISKTKDMVKEEWVLNNLGTIFDAIEYLKQNDQFTYENMTINDVDILREKWERPPLEWPIGVQLDSFTASSNKVSLVIETSYGTKTITYEYQPIQE